jgi:hypothetical protein
MRGGGFNYSGPGSARCAVRGGAERQALRWAIGLRVARSLIPDD